MTPLYVRIRGRVQGPFELEKLRWLVRSGRLARFHEVSENQLSWRQASEIPELFESNGGPAVQPTSDSPLPDYQQPGTHSTQVTTTPATGVAQETSQKQWHYAVGNTSSGPVATATIKDLVRSGALGTDGKVWHEGMSDWKVWHAVPELAALSRSKHSAPGGARHSFFQQNAQPLAITAVLAVLVLLVAAGSTILFDSRPSRNTSNLNERSQSEAKSQPRVQKKSKDQIDSEEDSQPIKKSQPPADSNFITSIRQHDDIRSAVGFVVFGWEVLFADGRQFQFQRGSGSAFAVSKDGFMLTNKHVIEIFDNWSRANGEYLKTEYMDGSGVLFSLAEWAVDSQRIEELKKRASFLLKIREAGMRAVQRATPKLWVFVMGEAHEARIIDIHGRDDLAILKIEKRFPKRFRILGAPQEPLLDVEVRAIGFPGTASIALDGEKNAKKRDLISIEISEENIIDALVSGELGKPSDNIETSFEVRELNYAMTNGRVSQVAVDSVTRLNWLQHSARIFHGNSGGPLVSQDGVVLGINSNVVKDELESLFRAFCLAQPDVRGFIDKNIPGKVTWVNTLPES